MKLIRVLLLAAAITGTARAEAPPGLEITEYGAYAIETDGVSTDPAYAMSGGHKMNLLRDMQLVRPGNRFAAQLCLTFGVRVALTPPSDTLDLPIDVRVTHPLMPEPDGHMGTVITWKTTVTGTRGYVGMTLDQETDLVPGTWTFDISTDGRPLVSQQFEMLPPRPGAPALDGCGAPVS